MEHPQNTHDESVTIGAQELVVAQPVVESQMHVCGSVHCCVALQRRVVWLNT